MTLSEGFAAFSDRNFRHQDGFLSSVCAKHVARKTKMTEVQIAFVLNQGEPGINVEDVCLKMGISGVAQEVLGCSALRLRRLRQVQE